MAAPMGSNLSETIMKFQNMIHQVEQRFAEREQKLQKEQSGSKEVTGGKPSRGAGVRVNDFFANDEHQQAERQSSKTRGINHTI